MPDGPPPRTAAPYRWSSDLHDAVLGVLTRRQGEPDVPQTSSTQERRDNRVKRPLNCFMIFRSALYHCASIPGLAQQNLSKDAAQLWHALPQDSPIRIICQALSVREAAAHRKNHPNYKYAPRRRSPAGSARKSASAAGQVLAGAGPIIVREHGVGEPVMFWKTALRARWAAQVRAAARKSKDILVLDRT